MDRTHVAQDKSLAQEICQALLAGDRRPLEKLVAAYQQVFLPFARRRLFNPQELEDVLQNFWAELMNARAICWYARQAGDQTSLRSYCLGILNRRVIDRNRQVIRERQRQGVGDDPPADPENSPENLLADSVADELARGLVHRSLIQLAAQSPRDAELLRWHLDGLSYEEMALRLLGPSPPDTGSLQKKINAVKKQFTRAKSGSLARFRDILLELMQARGLRFDDLL